MAPSSGLPAPATSSSPVIHRVPPQGVRVTAQYHRFEVAKALSRLPAEGVHGMSAAAGERTGRMGMNSYQPPCSASRSGFEDGPQPVSTENDTAQQTCSFATRALSQICQQANLAWDEWRGSNRTWGFRTGPALRHAPPGRAICLGSFGDGYAVVDCDGRRTLRFVRRLPGCCESRL